MLLRHNLATNQKSECKETLLMTQVFEGEPNVWSLSYKMSLPHRFNVPRKDNEAAQMGKSGETEAKDCTGFWEQRRSSGSIPSEKNSEPLWPLKTEVGTEKMQAEVSPQSTKPDQNTDRGLDGQFCKTPRDGS